MNTTIRRKRCSQCGKYFAPEKNHYSYCASCQTARAPEGWRNSKQSHNKGARIYGGAWRTTAEVRPVVLKGPYTRIVILAGFKDFLEHLYGRPAGLSTLLMEAGLKQKEVELLKRGNFLDDLVIRFCPKLRQELIEVVGFKSAELLIEFYGLYGDKRVGLGEIAQNLGLADEAHAQNLLNWAIRQLREPEPMLALKKLSANTVYDLLRDKKLL